MDPVFFDEDFYRHEFAGANLDPFPDLGVSALADGF